jgi:hypothetical protein
MYGRYCGMNTCKITRKNLKYCDIMLPWQHLPQCEPVFSVGQLLILHVKSMFGKYRLGVAAYIYF